MSPLAELVRDSPPGELEAIRRDIEVLSAGSTAVSRDVANVLEEANPQMLRVVHVEGDPTILSEYNKLGPNEYWSGSKCFKVDPASGKTEVTGEHEPVAAKELKKSFDDYVADHYTSDAVSQAFETEMGIALLVVGRKLSPQNFHNGQWAASYLVDGDSIKGRISIDVHYFEDGNVRLKAAHDVNTFSASAIEAICKAENEFEIGLNKRLVGLNEGSFKALRRQLPLTRSQMTWGKAVANYKLGTELEKR